MIWSYGVTTVPERFGELLPRTLKSLAAGGFPTPRLLIDGEGQIPESLKGYEITQHIPKLRTFGNWITAAWELYLRQPQADRYAIFQDDFVTYRNLRQYLETVPYPTKGYWNLYLFPENEKTYKGWYLSNQLGRGAVALVFDNLALRTLLKSPYLVDRPLDRKRGHKAVDGGIVTAMKEAGYQEYVHNPSLVQHTGEVTSMGNRRHEQANTFYGDEFNALDLLPKPAALRKPKSTKRIGLVGYNCQSGLGELNRQLVAYCDIDTWLIKPHPQYATNPSPDTVDVIVCPKGTYSKFDEFLKRVDTVLFCEQPYYPGLAEYAKAKGKRVVCVPMMEWMPAGAKGWPKSVDLFLCPTKQCYDLFCKTVPCMYCPWPVDTERFKYQQRLKCERFLFLNGHGGYQGRKGADVVKRAKQLWPAMPLLVRSQTRDVWPKGTTPLPPALDNAGLYREGDVLLVPHSVDGLGLEVLEALACGMPVISTDGKPWNEFPALGRIEATIEMRRVNRPVEWYLPNAKHLVEMCRHCLGGYLHTWSEDAYQWATARSWTAKAAEMNNLIRYGSAREPENVLQEAIP